MLLSSALKHSLYWSTIHNFRKDRNHLKIWGADDAGNPDESSKTAIAPVNPVDSDDDADDGDYVNNTASGVDDGRVVMC